MRDYHLMVARPDYEDWRPDVWILNARLALWMSASRQESTSSERFQLSSHICDLERNLIADRTLNGIRKYCWNIRTDASWNKLKLLDTEEGPDEKFSRSDGWCLDSWVSGRNISSSGQMQGIRFLWLGICAESSRNISLKKTSEN